jgi:hypothetical protein
MNCWRKILAGLLLLAVGLSVSAANTASFAQRIAPLIDPAKLATLGERGANPRVQKYVAQLAGARQVGIVVSNAVSHAVALAGMKGEAAKLTAEAMLRNLTIAERLGCLDKAGLSDMQRGRAPTIQRGPYAGDKLSVDHIIPRAVCPELDKVIANLELMPLRMNESKNAKVGERQIALAEKFHAAGLLSQKGLQQVKLAGK